MALLSFGLSDGVLFTSIGYPAVVGVGVDGDDYILLVIS